MSWFKFIIIGFLAYWIIFISGFVLFVGLGLGYSFSKLANKFSAIMAFPTGTGKNHNIFVSMIFWTIIIAVLVKGFSFFIGNRPRKNKIQVKSFEQIDAEND